MAIDEAIAKEKEEAKRLRKIIETGYDGVISIEAIFCDDTSAIKEAYERFENCAKRHEQLAEWLEELKALKNGLDIKCDNLNEALEKGKKVGYNKAIDDFSERLIEELSHTTLLKDGYYLANIIKPLAEQLKEGVNNES